jgi:hypothetical protein
MVARLLLTETKGPEGCHMSQLLLAVLVEGQLAHEANMHADLA